jgi:peptide/nickel transport system permease protein
MASYILRRLWQMVPTLLGVILLIFFLFKYFGGDPAEILGGLQATPEQIKSIRNQLGLDRPVWEQLWIFIQQIATFDWGKSWATNEAVSNIFKTRLPATLTIMIPILMLEVVLAIAAGMLVAYVRGSLTDRTVMVVSTVALSISFLVYIIVGQYCLWFPAGLVPGAGLDRQHLDQPGRLRAAAGAAGGAGGPGAADAAVPQLLPRRTRAGLRAHRACQGHDRDAASCSSTCCATR